MSMKDLRSRKEELWQEYMRASRELADYLENPPRLGNLPTCPTCKATGPRDGVSWVYEIVVRYTVTNYNVDEEGEIAEHLAEEADAGHRVARSGHWECKKCGLFTK